MSRDRTTTTRRSRAREAQASGLDGLGVRENADSGAVKAPRTDDPPVQRGITLTFILPLPPNQNREQGHWAARHRRKMAYFSECDQLQVTRKIPAPPAAPMARVSVRALMVMPAAMDPDNAKYRASKWPMDYLKSRGYIANDTAKVVTWEGDPEQVITRKNPSWLRLTITPAEAA